jgi:hypothetical protein
MLTNGSNHFIPIIKSTVFSFLLAAAGRKDVKGDYFQPSSATFRLSVEFHDISSRIVVASVMLFFRLFFCRPSSRRGAEGERQQERADDDVHG